MTLEASYIIEENDSEKVGHMVGDVILAISLFETVTHMLRKERERTHFTETVNTAVKGAEQVAKEANENIYQCECGNIYGLQQAYASHQQWCEG